MYRIFISRLLFIAVLVSGLSGCAFLWGYSADAKPLPTREIDIGGNRLTVELAVTSDQRGRGLMFRKAMDENHGMLFVYPEERHLLFWMMNTEIPLSVAFIGSDGVIRRVADMEPESLAITRSEVAARYALEVNQGYFKRHHIRVGDRVIFPSAPSQALAGRRLQGGLQPTGAVGGGVWAPAG